jgi:hypothetical protein
VEHFIRHRTRETDRTLPSITYLSLNKFTVYGQNSGILAVFGSFSFLIVPLHQEIPNMLCYQNKNNLKKNNLCFSLLHHITHKKYITGINNSSLAAEAIDSLTEPAASYI